MESLVEATSGAVGALVSTTVLYPLDTCKTKYQAENRSHHHQRYRNMSDVLWEAISNRQPLDTASSRMQTSEFGKSEGFWKSLSEGTWSDAFDGLGISLLLTTNPSIQYTVFDQLKQKLLKEKLKKNSDDISSPEALSAFSAFALGAVSKCIATILTYPAIRCKVMIQAAKSDENDEDKAQSKSRKTVSGTLYSIWEKEGLLGFYKGLDAQMLKTVLSSALLLMIKEKITKTTWVLMIALRRFMLITKPRLKSS
ncbi:hypothetical protein RD792_010064 [Penstemon davidsonii]|uniref:Peroxisomal adenine nucleotide carrier 1 n=1 Tax=Penstemon davidsonii TaxID=160366 RepID=A0ABR0D259_9LAMI|nr:hypothetical protein RD792_010064 [Penstemon davidsonii]